MNKDLVKMLEQSVKPQSLSAIAQAQKAVKDAKSSFLLLDCSGSMGEHCEPNRPKITALREVVDSLRKGGLDFTQVVFPGGQFGAEISAAIPEPGGSTPLHAALEVANVEGAKHVVVVSDGIPDDEHSVELIAQVLKKKGVKVDVFYVGPYPHPGEKFLKGIASMTGGRHQATSLATAKRLSFQQEVRKALGPPKQ